MFFFAVGFDAGAGTGRFFQKLLSADALTHPGFSERALFPLFFTDGAIIDISDVYEKFALEPPCPVEHNPEVHTAAYLDVDTVLYLDFQEACPAMSLCFSFPLVNGAFLVLLVVFSSSGQRIPLALFTVEHQRKALPASWRQFSTAVDATCCGEQCSPVLSGPVEKTGYMVKSMRLIPTNKVGQACERVGLPRLPREAGFDQERGDKTPNAHGWRLACGASLPVAIDAMYFAFRL